MFLLPANKLRDICESGGKHCVARDNEGFYGDKSNTSL